MVRVCNGCGKVRWEYDSVQCMKGMPQTIMVVDLF